MAIHLREKISFQGFTLRINILIIRKTIKYLVVTVVLTTKVCNNISVVINSVENECVYETHTNNLRITFQHYNNIIIHLHELYFVCYMRYS